MPDASPPSPDLITELQVSAHLMKLDAGVYCVHHKPGSTPPDAVTGLPGACLTLPPGAGSRGVTITGFRDDGWIGALDSAALVRVSRGPAQVLMTVYQQPNSGAPAPQFQVTRLVEGMQTAAAAQGIVPPPPAPEGLQQAETDVVSEPEVAAHVQVRGDILGRLGDWIGEPGSHRWVEGFAVAPRRPELTAEDIEYQAVLGRGWLSPWAEGGQYCGSRGMALPILGLRVRLRGEAAKTHTLQITASFTDGSSVGPVGPGDACEAESLAPLEAFRIELAPASKAPAAVQPAPKAKPAPRPAAIAKPASAKAPLAKPQAAKPQAAKPQAAKPQAAKPPVAAKPISRPAPAPVPPPKGRRR